MKSAAVILVFTALIQFATAQDPRAIGIRHERLKDAATATAEEAESMKEILVQKDWVNFVPVDPMPAK